MAVSLKKFVLAGGLLAALVLLAYSNSFHAGFHYDDFHQIVDNQNIRSLEKVPCFFRDSGCASDRPGLKRYRPMTLASFAVNYAITGYDVWSYHLFNILLHLLDVLLVFLVIKTIVGATLRERAFYPALVVSLLFALHPIQTESVTYISGRAVLLASFFYLAAFLCFIRYRAGGNYIHAVAAPILFFLGLLSKEFVVSLPAVMFAYDLIFVRPWGRGPNKTLKTFLYYAPFLAFLIVYVYLKKSLQGFVATPDEVYGIRDYLLSEAKVLLVYLRLLVMPANQNADYVLPLTVSVDAKVVVSALLVAAAVFFLYRLRRENPVAAFFGFWFFLTLLPESSLFPIADIAVEHRLYLPSVGFIACISLLCADWLGHQAVRKATATAVVVLFGILTFARNEVWASELTLWSDVVKKSLHSARAHFNLGRALYTERRYNEAMAEYKESLELYDGGDMSAKLCVNVGLCFFNTGDYGRAVEAFSEAINLEPDLMEAYVNLGEAFYRLKLYPQSAEALERAVRVNPGYAGARLVLAKSYTMLGRKQDALREVKEAVRCSPKDFEAVFDLAVIYSENGMNKEALEWARTSLELAPDPGRQKFVRGFITALGGGS